MLTPFSFPSGKKFDPLPWKGQLAVVAEAGALGSRNPCCREAYGRSSSPFWDYADRDLGSPSLLICTAAGYPQSLSLSLRELLDERRWAEAHRRSDEMLGRPSLPGFFRQQHCAMCWEWVRSAALPSCALARRGSTEAQSRRGSSLPFFL